MWHKQGKCIEVSKFAMDNRQKWIFEIKIAVVNTIQIYQSTSNVGQFHTKGYVFIVELKR